ncbi:DUF3997 domain-containing protein [Rubellicoccus peritrichatus]|uniref:DUF3997 domain-containing protein n=1 Tax=Rubellicoccus peritrichatus TaxID=3080537 RepID=A0AAQ3LFQ8_9BACT|nr:DUF3997 domain-containing protein [Puniceicoccus sp. CR14]WOO43749.1 DUF3997 domain-containing protein [Puniceicoccus sp. CR14]
MFVFALICSCDAPPLIGPGTHDFHAPVSNGYSIWRTSSHQISIAPDSYVSGSTAIIPTKVIECDFDERFVIAKRQGLRQSNPDDTHSTHKEPDPSVFDYWILDTSQAVVYGPFNSNEFREKRKELGVPNSLALKNVYDFKPKDGPSTSN